MVAGPGAQKLLVVLNRRRAKGADALCNRNRRRDARRVLVDVKRPVKVRDARPFVGDKLVRRKVRAVVVGVDLAVNVAQHLR